MYAVIMAGGGGTRLHPLSRPERPKPFLPLLGTESLLQATAARLPTDDITVVTDRRYERFVKDQLPSARILLEPMGRNTAAAIALATLAIEQPEDEVMIVVPADAHIDPARDGVYREVLRTAAEHLATGLVRHRAPARHPGRPGRVAGDHLRLPDPGPRDAPGGPGAGGLSPVAVRGEAQRRTGRGPRSRSPASPGTPGIFLWQRRAIRAALGRFTGLLQTLGPMAESPAMLERAYESIQRAVSIDYAVMEGAAQDHQVVMGSMDVGWSDLGSWTALLAAHRRARARARSCRRARP